MRMAAMGSYVGIIGSQLNCLENIRRCRLVGGGVSVGVEFDDSKAQARPDISLLHLFLCCLQIRM